MKSAQDKHLKTHNKRNTIIVSICGFLVLFFSLWYYFSASENHPHIFKSPLLNVGEKTINVRLKWVHNAQFAGLYTAIEKGFFRNKDLNVRLLERNFSKSVAKEVAENKVEFGITNSIDLIRAVNNGEKVKAVAAIYQKSPTSIISLTSKNIITPADFKHKKLGIVSKTADTNLIYQQLLKKYNIEEKDVEFVVTGINSSKALLNDSVDAVIGYRTDVGYELSKNNESYRIMQPEFYGIEMYDDVVITSDYMINENPDEVRKFIKGLQEGWNYAYLNPQEAIDVSVSKASAPHNNEWRQRYIFSSSETLIKPTDDFIVGSMSEPDWQNTIDTLYEFKIINNKPEALSVFTDRFIH